MEETDSGSGAGSHFLSHFDAVRIINLEHRSDRRAEMLAELRRIGLHADPRIAFHQASKFDDKGAFPTIGTRGCFHSHLAVLDEAVSCGANSVLILEDDVDFSRDVLALMPPVANVLGTKDWSIFYGGVLEWAGLASAQGPVATAKPEDGIMGGHFIAFRGPAIAATAAYLSAMLQRPEGSPEGGPMHVDGAYSWFRNAHPHCITLVAEPHLGHQRPSRTDIHQLRLLDRLPLLQPVMSLLRRLKRQSRS